MSRAVGAAFSAVDLNPGDGEVDGLMSDVSARPGAREYTVRSRRSRRTTWDGGRAHLPDFTPAEVHPEGASRDAEPKAKRGTGGRDQAAGDGPAGRESGERDRFKPDGPLTH